jgi:hypothetical protein
MNRVNRALVIPIAFGLIGLAACVVLPIPVDHTKGRVVDPKIPIEIGVTTRDEIIARAGEPDAIWEDEHVFAYNWEHAKLLWIVVLIRVGGESYSYNDEMLLIQFDASGRVARAERVERPEKMSYGEFLRSWAKGDVRAKP